MKHKRFDEYVKKIAKAFKMPKKKLFDDIGEREVVDARQILYFVCFENGFQLVNIQRLMTSKGYEVKYHTTISHGIKRIREKIKKDADYKQLIEDICTN